MGYSGDIIVNQTKDYKAHINVCDGLIFFHIEVYSKLTKTLLRELREGFNEACLYLDALGYDRVFFLTHNVKFSHLLLEGKYEDIGYIQGDSKLLVIEFDEVLKYD